MNKFRSAIMLITSLSLSSSVLPQKPIIYDKPVRLRHLVGTVLEPRGFTVEHAKLELWDPQSRKLIQTTFSNPFGSFGFTNPDSLKELEIHVSCQGYQSVQYTVELNHHGAKELRVTLPITLRTRDQFETPDGCYAQQ